MKSNGVVTRRIKTTVADMALTVLLMVSVTLFMVGVDSHVSLELTALAMTIAATCGSLAAAILVLK